MFRFIGSLIRWFIVLALLGGAALYYFWDNIQGLSTEVLIPRTVVERQVGHRFPTARSQGVMTVRISNPVLDFQGSRNRLGVIADTEVRILGIIPVRGKVHCDGSLAYRPETGAFVFTDVLVRSFQVDGLPESQADQASGLIGSAVLAALGGLEVYRLNPNEVHGRLASYTLRGIRITDRGIAVRLALRE